MQASLGLIDLSPEKWNILKISNIIKQYFQQLSTNHSLGTKYLCVNPNIYHMLLVTENDWCIIYAIESDIYMSEFNCYLAKCSPKSYSIVWKLI